MAKFATPVDNSVCANNAAKDCQMRHEAFISVGVASLSGHRQTVQRTKDKNVESIHFKQIVCSTLQQGKIQH